MNPTIQKNSLWIKSPTYDLSFIFGGALLTLLVPLIALLSPVLLVPFFFWVWVFFFEGSHFWATYSRTYLDARFGQENPGVPGFSLIFLVLPAFMVGIASGTGNPLAMNLYGFFIFTWSLYHNTRQHFGFVSIYNRKAGASEETIKKYRWGMYLATYAPMAHFFLSYKLGADFPGIYQSIAGSGVFSEVLLKLPLVLAAGSLLYLVGLRKTNGSPIAWFYILNCIIFYNTMFFVIAPLEPFLPGPANFSQKLMIVSIMNSLFHNIQYHAIVWFYSRKRYAEAPRDGFYGLAKTVNSRFPTYALAALTFSALFSLIFWWRAEIPFLVGGVSSGALSGLAYALYFGVVGHHFYLDQKIWRVGRSKELSGYLSLASVLGQRPA